MVYCVFSVLVGLWCHPWTGYNYIYYGSTPVVLTKYNCMLKLTESSKQCINMLVTSECFMHQLSLAKVIQKACFCKNFPHSNSASTAHTVYQVHATWSCQQGLNLICELHERLWFSTSKQFVQWFQAKMDHSKYLTYLCLLRPHFLSRSSLGSWGEIAKNLNIKSPISTYL